MARAKGGGCGGCQKKDCAGCVFAEEAVERFEASSVSEPPRTRKPSKGKKLRRKGERMNFPAWRAIDYHQKP